MTRIARLAASAQAACVACCICACFLAGPAWAELYALVIGIDEYDHAPDLDGAVNDAEDIADAVRALGPAELTVLINRQATRDAILDSWRGMAARAGAGDTILVTYAGHGGSEPAAHPDAEGDPRDENFQLSGFAPEGAAAAERIRDDEIAALIALSPEARVIVVADSCYSGTVTRATRAQFGYRFNPVGEIVDDPLPPVPRTLLPEAETGDGNIFFGAVPETEKVLELAIEDRPRGALSYAFAKGLRGAADSNGDGVIGKGELEFYVRKMVDRLTDGHQQPQVAPAGRSNLPLFRSAGAPAPEPNPFDTPFDQLPPVPLQIVGPGDTGLLYAALTGIVAARTEGERLEWDLRDGHLRSHIGDIILRLRPGPGVEQLPRIQRAIDKMRVVRHLRAASLSRDLDLSFLTGTAIYRPNQRVEVRLRNRQYDFPVIFNLAADGRLAHVYPIPQLGDLPRRAPSDPIGFPIWAAPPFGADHLIAVETPRPVPPLMRTIARRRNGQADTRALWTDLHHALRGQTVALALFPFFSAPVR